jgi:D-alanyl-D-alanine carboxypeptidase
VALTNQCQGDLRQLMFSFFSFLNRRTDFYLVPPVEDVTAGVAKTGFPEGDAEKLLLAAFRQFPLWRIPPKKQQQQQHQAQAPVPQAPAPAGPSLTSTTDISTPVAAAAAAAKKVNTVKKDASRERAVEAPEHVQTMAQAREDLSGRPLSPKNPTGMVKSNFVYGVAGKEYTWQMY